MEESPWQATGILASSGSSNSQPHPQPQQTSDSVDRPKLISQTHQCPMADKRLHELRVLALEYVKQIVVKAGELAQDRRTVKLVYSFASSQRLSGEQPVSFRDTASQINQRFQLRPTASPSRAFKPPAPQISSDDLSNTQASLLLTKPQQNQLQQSTNTEPKQHNKNQNKKEKRRSARNHRINWGLVISCFSTCLPSTLTEAVVTPGAEAEGPPDRS